MTTGQAHSGSHRGLCPLSDSACLAGGRVASRAVPADRLGRVCDRWGPHPWQRLVSRRAHDSYSQWHRRPPSARPEDRLDRSPTQPLRSVAARLLGDKALGFQLVGPFECTGNTSGTIMGCWTRQANRVPIIWQCGLIRWSRAALHTIGKFKGADVCRSLVQLRMWQDSAG